MGSYEIRWKQAAERELRKQDKPIIGRIVAAIDSLTANPFPPQNRKLAGTDRHYRIRIGDYRVIYTVDTVEKAIVIQHIRHRKDAYR